MIFKKLKLEQQIRFMQFEEVSNRVRIAKENGLWRSTSWGGSFQQVGGGALLMANFYMVKILKNFHSMF